eukprot:TRINITY_DN1239_c0_g1_i3.p1 TRINITY_DN1239_c0_g1~~TRINITY_DN1239_c0_g1_i3.p1  ORF type:complete len:420 (-),score=61.35 TRINITY_DN1239_c0_g1_i3:43-1302(-)
MYGVMLAFGTWFRGSWALAVHASVMATLLGWPFVAVIFVPMALEFFLRAKLTKVLSWGFSALTLFLVPMIAVDYYYFRRILVAPLNILIYNVFSGSGSEKYGIEEWPFYFKNGFLNLNFVFFLAFSSFLWGVVGILMGKGKFRIQGPFVLLKLMPLYIWFLIMQIQPHKEERFLYPIYPLFCFAGALSLSIFAGLLQHFFIKFSSKSIEKEKRSNFKRKGWENSRVLVGVVVLVCVVVAVVSVSRTTSLLINYRAPLLLYSDFYHLSSISQQNSSVNLCVGKEWYRFPSNFFLPDLGKFSPKFQFLRSEFRGLLPRHYDSSPSATWIIPPHMNDQNLEELSRYVDVSECDYIVDQDDEKQREERYAVDEESWKVVGWYPFLDSESSPSPHRAFWVPFVSATKNKFNRYVLLQSTRSRKL